MTNHNNKKKKPLTIKGIPFSHTIITFSTNEKVTMLVAEVKCFF